ERNTNGASAALRAPSEIKRSIQQTPNKKIAHGGTSQKQGLRETNVQQGATTVSTSARKRNASLSPFKSPAKAAAGTDSTTKNVPDQVEKVLRRVLKEHEAEQNQRQTEKSLLNAPAVYQGEPGLNTRPESARETASAPVPFP
ncbi:unnamed protein product, partial [Amoebophrya sp. A120]